MNRNRAWLAVALRLMMALLFLVSATTKVAETAMIQGYMRAFGVPELLVWPAAAWEYMAGGLLLVGLLVRPMSLLLAGWCVLTALIFHTKFSDLDQLMNFFKNITMAGGFLMIAVTGHGASVWTRCLSHAASLPADLHSTDGRAGR
jgi:putative oxidoreductase